MLLRVSSWAVPLWTSRGQHSSRTSRLCIRLLSSSCLNPIKIKQSDGSSSEHYTLCKGPSDSVWRHEDAWRAPGGQQGATESTATAPEKKVLSSSVSSWFLWWCKQINNDPEERLRPGHWGQEVVRSSENLRHTPDPDLWQINCEKSTNVRLKHGNTSVTLKYTVAEQLPVPHGGRDIAERHGHVKIDLFFIYIDINIYIYSYK